MNHISLMIYFITAEPWPSTNFLDCIPLWAIFSASHFVLSQCQAFHGSASYPFPFWIPCQGSKGNVWCWLTEAMIWYVSLLGASATAGHQTFSWTNWSAVLGLLCFHNIQRRTYNIILYSYDDCKRGKSQPHFKMKFFQMCMCILYNIIQ